MNLLEKLAKHHTRVRNKLLGMTLTDRHWEQVKPYNIQAMSDAMDILLNEGGLSQQAQDEIYQALHSDAP